MFANLRNRSLFKQLIVPMLLVGVIGAAAIITSAMALQNSVQALGEMYAASADRLQTLQEIDNDIADVRALSLKHLTSNDTREMEKTREDLVIVEQQIKTNLPTILHHNLSGSETARQEAAILREVLATYLRGIDGAVAHSTALDKEMAFVALTGVENRHLTDIQIAMQTLMRYTMEDIAASRADLVTAAHRTVQMNLIVGFLGGTLLLGVAFYVSRRASRRLDGLVAWSRRIARGDLADPLVSNSRDEIGELTLAMNDMVRDLAHSRRELEQARHDAEATAGELQQYATAFHRSGQAMLITDRHNLIVNANPAFTQQTGYALEEIRGRNPNMLSKGDTPKALYEDMWRCLRDKDYWSGELWDRKKNGEIFPKWSSISAIRDANRAILFYIASYSDISERKANEARIDYLAHHDDLTGLINRYNLENRLDQALLSSSREGVCLAVMFIDMDRFKNINDTLGHHIGDMLLIEVAARLSRNVRESDIVARLGGDEFIVVLTGITEVRDVAHLSDKILQALREPYMFDGKELHSSPSIGIAVFPHDGEDAPALMRNADTAMYHAKKQGRNNAQYFSAEMNAGANERLSLENDLHQALRDNLLHLHYQPQVRATDGHCFGVEALVRWHHPVLGDVSPLRFIPAAEESSLIETLGDWVLEEACRQLGIWRAEGVRIRVAVNLSAQHLGSPRLIAIIKGLLSRHGLQGSDLELEITESTAMANPEHAIRQLQALRDLGIQLAIDDFGTGYSSLAYLKRLPIQILKLDRTFVRDIETNPGDAEISAATLALAHNLGLKVIAEGVETEAQRAYLLRHRCDFMQGYLFSEPLPADAVPAFVRAHRPLAAA